MSEIITIMTNIYKINQGRIQPSTKSSQVTFSLTYRRGNYILGKFCKRENNTF